jgi:hypothetical protein
VCAEEGDKKYFLGGKKKKMGVNRIFGAWRCFGKNPYLATKVLKAKKKNVGGGKENGNKWDFGLVELFW